MMNTPQLNALFKDANYKLTQFEKENTNWIERLENSITMKEVRGNDTPYITCLVRRKSIKLTPEEAVRQLYIMQLQEEYEYPLERMELEYAVSFGREKKRADIVVFDKNDSRAILLIVELKKPKLKDGKEQLKSYCNATGAPMGVWTNGETISHYHRKDPNYFEDIPDIPNAHQKLKDILTQRWYIADLVKHDKLVNERKSLKGLILEMEDEVLANAGVDVFEELFKLIFAKLYDEMESGRNKSRALEFRNYGDTETDLKAGIQKVFDEANAKWEGVFSKDAKLMLTPSHLSVCVSSLQDVKLFNSNLDVVDEAFEYLINKSSKGEKGQYFTPRYVIDMCVKILNPQAHETLIDTAAGSCGFPVHSIFHVWEQQLKARGKDKSHLFTTEHKEPEMLDYVQNNVFAIDFDEKAVRVSRTLNLIAGDGQTNVLHLNALDYERWDEKVKEDEAWQDTYFDGWRNIKKLRKTANQNRDFQFDVLMANPPFAGEIKESRILAKYDLGKKPNGKAQTKVTRDILFIERNLDFLKDGGRMAVVLPQGRFNNSSDKAIRDYIAERCRILAVVGLHGNVFKPHTSTKTSVLFVQKWDDKLCPRVEDYPIFFATMQEPSKDNSGDKIYVKKKDYATKPSPEGEGWVRGKAYVPPELIKKARKLRKSQTDAEQVMWAILRNRNFLDLKFRRQHPVTPYILDFYCYEHRLAIEIDGGQHNEELQQQKDAVRTEFLDKQDIKVLRFWNNEVLQNIEGVLESIAAALPPHPSPLPQERGHLLNEDIEAQPINSYDEPPEDLDQYLLDDHGHLIVKHDLFNHDGLTKDGIAEAFTEFAKKEGLSFVGKP